jgi:uncharacterized membrane protein
VSDAAEHIGADREAADACGDDNEPESFHERLQRIERLLDPRQMVQAFESEIEGALDDHVIPAWRRATQGEHRTPIALAVVLAIGLMVVLPSRIANHPRWGLPGLAILLLAALVIANPRRIDRHSRGLRIASLLLIAVLSAANILSAARLVLDLARSEGIRSPTTLLLSGAAIWLTNVIVFALWYWEFDRGGPARRAAASHPHPDFLFPQMTSPDLCPADWEPRFVDYLYMSFTNATAFSPTDVMPMSRWSKLTMLLQSAVSLVTVALVIARAINVLK